ncbi:MAG: bifunctional heptose 7-phosphate kinase/heptose 1-phosphate adenyltransferase [Synergistaceae bacterium]|jgi:D-beta-D-heptose 7-phosphate kinase/D-beta-D-heptose 1-phosphate adenosyltransferase|nr:bifunctional heptose 7-phosphate kinase/heptose 1-phosphate adenyltransferase [Synergistaceae bacterium]
MKRNLSSYIDKFADVKVFCVGDIMLDRFLYGSVRRISPEAPVPVLNFLKEKQMLGGVGNVLTNLVSLGCRPRFAGVIGNDEHGKEIERLLAEQRIVSHLFKLNHYRTTTKTRFIAGNNHLLRVDHETTALELAEILPEFKAVSAEVVRESDVILLSDYNKGLLTQEISTTLIELALRYAKKVAVDPKGLDYSKYRGATLLKPNLKEFADVTRLELNPHDADFYAKVKSGAEYLFSKHKIENLLVTLGEHGMIFIPSNDVERMSRVGTEAKEVFDVSGAGDTALATLGVSLGAGASVREAMTLANMTSGLVVGKLGTASVAASELKRALALKEKENVWLTGEKMLDSEQIATVAKKLKEEGMKIGFTNGCFDCLHLGHLYSLRQARKTCDVLVVGVNSDASVKRYKGEGRPLQDERTRATLLASLEYVDYVVTFDEDTALPLARKIMPDVIAKEGYEADKWPEARFVESYGGEVVALRRLEGYSTSAMLRELKGAS